MLISIHCFIVIPIMLIALYDELAQPRDPATSSTNSTHGTPATSRLRRFVTRCSFLAVAGGISILASSQVALYMSLLVGVSSLLVSYLVPVLTYAGGAWGDLGWVRKLGLSALAGVAVVVAMLVLLQDVYRIVEGHAGVPTHRNKQQYSLYAERGWQT